MLNCCTWNHPKINIVIIYSPEPLKTFIQTQMTFNETGEIFIPPMKVHVTKTALAWRVGTHLVSFFYVLSVHRVLYVNRALNYHFKVIMSLQKTARLMWITFTIALQTFWSIKVIQRKDGNLRFYGKLLQKMFSRWMKVFRVWSDMSKFIFIFGSTVPLSDRYV